VLQALESSHRQLELMLREVSERKSGTIHFYSRETEPEQRPRLVVELNDGQTLRVAASADAHISCSTFRALGIADRLSVGRHFSTAIAFDLRDVPDLPIKRAALSLVSRERQQGDVLLGVFNLVNPLREGAVLGVVPTEGGVAAKYPDDVGLDRDPAVVMVANFDGSDWRRQWSVLGGDVEVTDDKGAFGFEPFAGRALKVRIEEGKRSGANLRFRFADRMGREPEEAYFRYMLRFGDDWRPDPDGGKLPGFAATYGRAGWGGRQADGANGWSARGSFNAATRPENPLHEFSTIGSYVYHADMPSHYGEGWPWTEGQPALLSNNRWYAVEQHVKLNTPGKNNGVLRAWVDGRLVFERTNLRFRDTPELRIEEVWVNVFFGGTRPSARTMHLFIDNLVIADRYIGPVRRQPANAYRPLRTFESGAECSMSPSPLVSVIMPAHNCARYIAEAVDSVLTQDYPHKELIVVDDGSATKRRQFSNPIGKRLRLLRQQNQGAAVARNRALAVAQGELVSFLDGDDVWLPGKLRAQVSYLSNHPGTTLVYGSWSVWRPDSAGRWPDPLRFADGYDENSVDESGSGWIYTRLLLDSIVCTITAMMPTELLRAVGGFDEELRIGEDYDLWLRLSRQVEARKMTMTMAAYRIHSASTTRRPSSVNYGHRVLARALERYGYEGPDGSSADAPAVQRRLQQLSVDFAYQHLRRGDPCVAAPRSGRHDATARARTPRCVLAGGESALRNSTYSARTVSYEAKS
jgi:GT2 family glycosyltransferase